MNWHTALSWWSALGARRAERRSVEVDHGDMGTAFGLDASFGPVEADRPIQRTVMPSPTPEPWEYRLTRRTGL